MHSSEGWIAPRAASSPWKQPCLSCLLLLHSLIGAPWGVLRFCTVQVSWRSKQNSSTLLACLASACKEHSHFMTARQLSVVVKRMRPRGKECFVLIQRKKKKSISTKTQVPKVFHHMDETHLSSKRDARLTRRIRYRTINYSELAIAKKKKGSKVLLPNWQHSVFIRLHFSTNVPVSRTQFSHISVNFLLNQLSVLLGICRK